MAITDQSVEYTKLRKYLNPYIKGASVDAVLNALATQSAYLVNSVDAVNSSLYVTTATQQYLDLRLADFGISRDPNIGLSDDIFRQIGIQVKNKKQIRTLINGILNSVFGDQFVKATSSAQNMEPYNLQDGDQLLINFDGTPTQTITFYASQFSSIASATAQEVANAIAIGLSNLGVSGSAVTNNDGNGNYVQLLSNTIGASSSVTVMGGRAQNVLFFNTGVAYSGNASTQYTITNQSGGNLRFTWTGGVNPNLGVVQPLQYVNIFGGGFASSTNEGTFTITSASGGTTGQAYFEIENPTGSTGTVTQGTDTAIQFYVPIRETILSKSYYAAVYQTEANVLQVFMPATTQIVERSRIGSAHLHGTTLPDSGPSLPTTLGPYVFDTSQGFTIGDAATILAEEVNLQSNKVILVNDSTGFPDGSGYIVIGYGCQDQEVVPYIAAPSGGSLLVSPAYTIQQDHPAGTSVILVAQKSPIVIKSDGSDYGAYLTDSALARIYSQEVIQSVAAAGINIVFTILYPNPIGLGGYENPIANEIAYVYGE